MKLRFSLSFLVLFFLCFISHAQRLQIQKILHSVSKVIQSPDGSYFVAESSQGYTLIDQKSKIQLASLKIVFDKHGSIGEGKILFFDDSRFILNTNFNLLLIDLLNNKVDTLKTSVDFPELIENFILLPDNPDNVLITTKRFPLQRNGEIQIVNEKKGQIFYNDIKNCRLLVYDCNSKKVSSSVNVPFSVTTLAIGSQNEMLAGTFDGNIVKINPDLTYQVLFKAFDKPVFSITEKKNTMLIIPHRGKNLILNSGGGELHFFDRKYNLKNKIEIPALTEASDTTRTTGLRILPNNYVLGVLNPKRQNFVYLNCGINKLLKIDLITASYTKLAVPEQSASFHCLNHDESQIIATISSQRSIFGNTGKLYLYDINSEKFVDVFRKIIPQTDFQKINKVFYNKDYFYIAENRDCQVFGSNSMQGVTLSAIDISYDYRENGLLLREASRLVYGTLKLDRLLKKNYHFKFKTSRWSADDAKDSLHTDILTPLMDISNYDATGLPHTISKFHKISENRFFISGFNYDKNQQKNSCYVIDSNAANVFELNGYSSFAEIKISPSGKFITIADEKKGRTVLEIWDWNSKKMMFTEIYDYYENPQFTFDNTLDILWFSRYDKNYLADIYSMDLQNVKNLPEKEFSKFKLAGKFITDVKKNLIAFENSGTFLFVNLSDKTIISSCSVSEFDGSAIKGSEKGFGFSSSNSFISFDQNLKPILFTSFEGNKPVEVTASLFYRANKEIINNVGFVMDGKGYASSDYDLYFNRPDITTKQSGSINEEYLSLLSKAVSKRTSAIANVELSDLIKNAPLVRINNTNEINSFTNAKSQLFDLSFSSSHNRKIKAFTIHVNGVNTMDTKSDEIPGSIKQDIKLSRGNNFIQISCTDSEGYISNTETYSIIADYEDNDPKVFLIAIAADSYHNKNYNLKYSVKDANDLIQILQNRYGSNFVQTSLINKNITSVEINQIKSVLKNADVNDKVILFVSGHGILDSNLDFRFATPDMNFEKPDGHGVSNNVLESILLSSPARNKLLMIDACHSGVFDKEEYSKNKAQEKVVSLSSGKKGITKTPIESRETSFELMRQLFSDVSEKSGIKVISAAAGDSYALESDEWKNGVFSYSLLQQLKKNKSILISEITKNIAESVTKLTGGAQQPTDRGNTIEFDFSL